MEFKFKELEIKEEGSWINNKIKSAHFKKTLISVIAGIGIGLLFYFFTDAKNIDNFVWQDAYQNMIFGGFIGLFITNSPCARGKC
jgi:hypothetical protein